MLSAHEFELFGDFLLEFGLQGGFLAGEELGQQVEVLLGG